jgi:hypothetical protein
MLSNEILKINEPKKLFSAHSLKGLRMLYFFRKYALIIAVLLFLSLLICVRLFPSYGLMLTMLFLLSGFFLASLPVIEKHRQAYLQGKISRRVYVHNVLFDVIGILFALTAAALLGRYIAAIVTESIGNELIKLIAGIMIGLLIGLAVGIFVQRSWRKLIKTSPEI